MATSEDLVLVTGASGFIASHVIKLLLEERFKVRGTVRSLKDEAKVSAIKKLKPDAKSSLELVEADLHDDSCWEGVIKGCTYVIHVAYAFPKMMKNTPKNEDDAIRSGVDVFLNMLKLAKETATVKRFILTGTIMSLFTGNPNQTELITEETWANLNNPKIPFYVKFKTIQERAAWDFIQNLPEGEKLDFVVIHPGTSFGPNLSATLTESNELAMKVLTGEMSMVPDVHAGFSDVRDVAAAHVKALTAPGAAGQRIVIDAGTHSFLQVVKIIQDEFKPQGYKIKARVAPKIMMQILSLFKEEVKFFASVYGCKPRFDSSKMRNILGIEPRPVKESVIDTCYNLIETGYVRKTSKYRGPEFK